MKLVVGRLEPDVAQRVTVTAAHQPVVLTVDRLLVERAIVNLVDNALRYSPAAKGVELRVEVRDARATLTVRDLGIGIPAEKQRQLFEPFFRAHTDTAYDTGGLGLGLYVTRAVATLHGGSVAAESKEGEGSTFELTLPLTAPQEAGQVRAS